MALVVLVAAIFWAGLVPASAEAALAPEEVEWMGSWLREIAHEAAGAPIESKADWDDLEVSGWQGKEGAKAFVVSLRRKETIEPFAHYYFIPWQPLYEPRGERMESLLCTKLLTVTGEALVFESVCAPDTSEEARALQQRISEAMAEAIGVEQHEQEPEGPTPGPPPEGLQAIAVNLHQRYVTVQVALPGSRMPKDAEFQDIWPGFMIELVLLPDKGPVQRRWIGPGPEVATVGVEQGRKTVEDIRREMMEPFGDYVPKLTPDTVLDYRGTINPRLEELPPAQLEALPALLARIEEQKHLAAKHRGRFTPGNLILGADPEEYQPSDEELLESEVGDRIQRVVSRANPAEIASILERAGIALTEVEYGAISFRHVDVMGSGRFFYASAPSLVRVLLRGR
jgi:hypothetical protein